MRALLRRSMLPHAYSIIMVRHRLPDGPVGVDSWPLAPRGALSGCGDALNDH